MPRRRIYVRFSTLPGGIPRAVLRLRPCLAVSCDQAHRQKEKERDRVDPYAGVGANGASDIKPMNEREEGPEGGHGPVKKQAMLNMAGKPQRDQARENKERTKLLGDVHD